MTNKQHTPEIQQHYSKLCEYTSRLSKSDEYICDLLNDCSDNPMPIDMVLLGVQLRSHIDTVRDINKTMQAEKAVLEQRFPSLKEKNIEQSRSQHQQIDFEIPY